MSRLATSFVLGFHGCDRSIADRAIRGDVDLLHSDKPYDWLGPGTYFWESDPDRALEWAREKRERGDLNEPAVIGAVIDLGNCLDLAGREGLEQVRGAHASFLQMQRDAGLPIPENKAAKNRNPADLHLRFLDCAVMRHLHWIIAQQRVDDAARIAPYDTVRAMFIEGEKLYDGSGLFAHNHVQIAVCNPASIKGLFLPRPDPSASSETHA